MYKHNKVMVNQTFVKRHCVRSLIELWIIVVAMLFKSKAVTTELIVP